MSEPPIALGVKDAAKAIGLSRSRFYELISSGQIDARKIGARTVIPYESLREFIATAPAMRGAT